MQLTFLLLVTNVSCHYVFFFFCDYVGVLFVKEHDANVCSSCTDHTVFVSQMVCGQNNPMFYARNICTVPFYHINKPTSSLAQGPLENVTTLSGAEVLYAVPLWFRDTHTRMRAHTHSRV